MGAGILSRIRRLAIGAGIAAFLAGACGGSTSAPSQQTTAPPAGSVATVSVTALTVTMETTATGFLYKVSFVLRETQWPQQRDVNRCQLRAGQRGVERFDGERDNQDSGEPGVQPQEP